MERGGNILLTNAGQYGFLWSLAHTTVLVFNSRTRKGGKKGERDGGGKDDVSRYLLLTDSLTSRLTGGKSSSSSSSSSLLRSMSESLKLTKLPVGVPVRGGGGVSPSEEGRWGGDAG